MAELKLEGDLTLISEQQLEYIKSAIISKGFKNGKAQIEAVGKAGDNYAATVKRIILEDNNGVSLRMIAKVAPYTETQRAMSNTALLFRNEVIMYTKVLPKFTQLEKAAEIPPQERLRYAICYGCCEEEPNEVILLEDLDVSNFKILNRMEPLGNDCIRSVLKNFAKLHSLGFQLKNKEPQLFEEYKSSLFDMWSSMQEQKEVLMYFKQMETNASRLVESDFHKKIVANSVTNSFIAYKKIALADKNSKHSIILQGDAWTNNIMFKFDGENLLGSIMIDYQISRVGNPATDILYLIFNCTDYETRKEYFYDWIDYYHSNLDKSLSNYDLKANYVYSRDHLDADLKRYGKLGLGQTVLLAAVLPLKAEEATVMKDAMVGGDIDDMLKSVSSAATDPETIKKIKDKIEGAISSFHEFGLL